MGAVREKDQADFDLERFVDMFDEALTSRDPRVINALRSLMMIVTLTRPESCDQGLHDRNAGPLRRLFEDMNNLNSRMFRMEDDLHRIAREFRREDQQVYKLTNLERYTLQAAAAQDRTALNQIKTAEQIKGLYNK